MPKGTNPPEIILGKKSGAVKHFMNQSVSKKNNYKRPSYMNHNISKDKKSNSTGHGFKSKVKG